jgi:hypothetical protein
MKLINKTVIAAALALAAASASAMTPMQDESLSAVSGQDGVSIAASLNVNIGEFKYTNKTENASISFENIKATGLMAATMDVISGGTFSAIRTATGVSGSFFNPASDVVQIAIPTAAEVTLPAPALLSVSVDAVRMGGSTASFGSMAMNQIDLRGTKVWIWAH